MRAIILFLVAFCFLQLDADAQIRDSLIYFKADLVNIKNFKASPTEAFTFAQKSQVITKSAKATGIKQLRNPLYLKRNGKCFKIQCYPTKECKDCAMLWKDRNGDGKVQPRKELRCGCKSSPKATCNMDWAQVQCR